MHIAKPIVLAATTMVAVASLLGANPADLHAARTPTAAVADTSQLTTAPKAAHLGNATHTKPIDVAAAKKGAIAAVVGPTVKAAKSITSSNNWAGMAAQAAAGTFQGAYGQWTQPTVSATSGNRYSCTWVGVDGASNSSLVQTGTEADSVGGRVS